MHQETGLVPILSVQYPNVPQYGEIKKILVHYSNERNAIHFTDSLGNSQHFF